MNNVTTLKIVRPSFARCMAAMPPREITRKISVIKKDGSWIVEVTLRQGLSGVA